MQNLIPFLAWRNIRARPLQSGLTMGAVAVGVAVLILALSLTNGFIDELVRSTLRATPHLTLQPFAADGDLSASPELLQQLESDPAVEAAAPFLATQALIARRANATLGISARQGFVQVLGIDPTAHARILDLPAMATMVGDTGEPGGIVLGASLAQQLGVVEGDEVMLRTLSGATLTLTVSGSYRVGNELIDGVIAYMPMAQLQALVGLEGRWSGIHLRMQDASRASLEGERLGAQTALRPTSWERLFSTLLQQLRLQKAVISVVVFLIVLVAAMGIANVLVVSVSEKTGEIAILRTLGAGARQVVGIFTLQGALLGGVGTLLGALLGVLLATYFRLQPFPLPGDLYFITQLPVVVEGFDIAWVCTVSLLTSTLAALLPARRAANLRPAEVLR